MWPGPNALSFPSFRSCRKYDLKGSTVDREASNKELEKDLPTYKDNNFMNDGTKVHIGEHAKRSLMETLTADVEVRTLTSLIPCFVCSYLLCVASLVVVIACPFIFRHNLLPAERTYIATTSARSRISIVHTVTSQRSLSDH